MCSYRGMGLQWRIVALLTAGVLSLFSASKACFAQTPQISMSIRQSAPMTTVAEEYLLRSINTERSSMGLKAVKFNPSLQAAAHGHALEMAKVSTLSHRLQGEADLLARGASAGAHFSRITENVAVGPSIVVMHDALMASPHHRENILDGEVDSIGISVVEANGSLWAVEDFSHSVEQLSLDEQETRVSDLLRSMQLDAAPDAEARATCTLSTGFVGARPMYTMRYTTGDLSQLPAQLRARMQSADARVAAVGACPAEQSAGSFASYNIAIKLFR